MTPEQSRAARALISWSQQRTADEARVALSTIRDFERGRHIPIANNLAAIKSALEQAGVTFLENGDAAPGAGVALRGAK